jgi:hypothetical protein
MVTNRQPDEGEPEAYHNHLEVLGKLLCWRTYYYPRLNNVYKRRHIKRRTLWGGLAVY